MNGESKLFAATGPLVVEQQKYYSGGAGYYMADFLAGRMYGDHLNIHQCVVLAAYVLFEAKEHVEGCGGESHIAILRNDGMSGRVDSKRIEVISRLLKFADDESGRFLLSAANFDNDEEQFRNDMDSIRDVVAAIREHERKDLRESQIRWESVAQILGGANYKPELRDDFGLPAIEPESSDEKD